MNRRALLLGLAATPFAPKVARVEYATPFIPLPVPLRDAVVHRNTAAWASIPDGTSFFYVGDDNRVYAGTLARAT